MGTNCDDEMSDGLHIAPATFAYSLICLRSDILDTNARLFLMFNPGFLRTVFCTWRYSAPLLR